MRVAGVDGTKKGCVAVVLRDGVLEQALALSLVTRFEELGDLAIVAIDIPIGFGPRAADSAARRFLQRAASTVFPTPPRSVLEQSFGPGLGVSAQAHALRTRILHITDLAKTDPRLREVHPEVSFRKMNGGNPLRYRKKTAGGVFERVRLLQRHGIFTANLDDLAEVATTPIDDVLDAGAAAWSAHRLATGRASSFPDPPEHVHGQSVAIWY